MNPSAASTSTLANARRTKSTDCNYTTIGGNFEQNIYNIVTGNHYSATGDHDASDANEEEARPIFTNLFHTLVTLLGSIFGTENDPMSGGAVHQQQVHKYDVEGHLEPGVIVTEITDSSIPVLSPVSDTLIPSVSPSSFSDWYTRSMLKCGQGYPLFEPDPDQAWEEGVKVGDVGTTTDDGGFDILFNICPSPDASPNPDVLPDGFEVLTPPEMLIKRHFNSGTRLFKNGVRRTERPDVRYTWKGPEGGILELPLGATRFEAKNKLAFQELAIRHAENWYKYTVGVRKRKIRNGSLYIVTSCIKCPYWGIAAFDQPSDPQDYLRFVVNEENQNGQPEYEWDGEGAFNARVTPNPSNDAGPNQCVFLRGYKIMLRKDIWENTVDSQFTGTPYATMSPYGPGPQSGNKSGSARQGGSSNQDDPQYGARSGPEPNYGTTRSTYNTCKDDRAASPARVVLYEYSKAPPTHPSDLINAVLLCQEPEAKLAITHDDDWCDLLQSANWYYPCVSFDYQQQQDSSILYTSNVDEYGCASLKGFSDLSPNLDVTSLELSSEICVTSTSKNHFLIDKTQPPFMAIDPVYKSPSMADYSFHPIMTRPSTSQSQPGHSIISSTTATLEKDANRESDITCEDVVMSDDSTIWDSFSIQPFTYRSRESDKDLSRHGRIALVEEPKPSIAPAFAVYDGATRSWRCNFNDCRYVSRSERDIERHCSSLKHEGYPKYSCQFCGNVFTRRDTLERHKNARCCREKQASLMQPNEDKEVFKLYETDTTRDLHNIFG